ncbi:cob(I)yrinic acid a,c-diamide adenosyltransferase [Cereibacter johrii]|uniref:Corrinoid adenosyltransferase n=1 Tax=Cereibacter johrii TaxID=445629 RepID=A0ABX5J8D5_9RHOB|nr:cob(I)yrinic acid a,c-diamide adenosyltransferase [Cereibacter johrii]ODM42411.1 ATP:cob(I)alamin adenosyltransferase [Cereibacter johrii]PTM78075.1 ATP:cob(I)alamin adenosyltransferase [Cereibacter johrii]
MGNRLTKIVTRTGDTGTTGLSDGARVDKDAPRMEVIGTVDELSSQLGLAQALIAGSPQGAALGETLSLLQHDLFDLGGALSMPLAPLLSEAHVARLDDILEALNAELPPLKEFILPGGSAAIAALHVARCVARRAERRLVSLLADEPQDGASGLAYLNRLSDLLFVMARAVARQEGVAEHYWQSQKSLSRS